ncbi:hypothetical protein DPMN_006598 [Dreissena polymorpha]|uniref:Uncharacterized protein n=1 Tax=Dreissena polymorpha TaxID=45954 RepID=A0A9D4MVR2_DREPO|nr:hypothetical protein DPMN_006598 [Dreissena polymorpha]
MNGTLMTMIAQYRVINAQKSQHLSCDTGIILRQYRKMMKGAVVEWKCRICSRPAEVLPEVPMETADIAEESELTAEVLPEVPMETADISEESKLTIPEISESQDSSYMSELSRHNKRPSRRSVILYNWPEHRSTDRATGPINTGASSR